MVVSCVDSRAPAELIFDLGLGDIFSVRVAGNVTGPMVLGSVEYACVIAGARLVLVLGHTRCGADKLVDSKFTLGVEGSVAGPFRQRRARTSSGRIRKPTGDPRSRGDGTCNHDRADQLKTQSEADSAEGKAAAARLKAPNASWRLRDVRPTFFYGDVEGMWLQTSSELKTNVRLFGPYTMFSRDIRYQTADRAGNDAKRPTETGG